jgi:hypothetical protein
MKFRGEAFDVSSDGFVEVRRLKVIEPSQVPVERHLLPVEQEDRLPDPQSRFPQNVKPGPLDSVDIILSPSLGRPQSGCGRRRFPGRRVLFASTFRYSMIMLASGLRVC